MKHTLKNIICIIFAVLFMGTALPISYNCAVSSDTVCKCDSLCPSYNFTDVPDSSSWMHTGIDFAVKRGYMSGVGIAKFAPNGNMTRAMLVLVTAKLDYADLSEYSHTGAFNDVKADGYYTSALEWAYQNGIIKGTAEAVFSPNGTVTREQCAMVLYAYAEYKGYNTAPSADISSFADSDNVSDWAENAVKWACAVNLISGVKIGDEILLCPKSPLTRAQTAVILKAFCDNVSLSLGKILVFGDSYSAFEDSVPDGYYAYYDANDDTVYSDELMWYGKLITETNSKLLRNDSFSGSTLSKTAYNGAYDNKNSFVSRLERFIETQDSSEVDTVIIFGGTNDSWASSSIGELKYGDFTNEDLKSFLPAFCYMIMLIQEKMPNAKIINICNCQIKDAIIKGMQQACEALGVLCVSPEAIDKELKHPTAKGMEQIKDAVIAELKKEATEN